MNEEEKPFAELHCKTETDESSVTYPETPRTRVEIEVNEREQESDLLEKLESEMSGFTESTPLLMPVKEIKEEEFDDFLQEHMFADQDVKGDLGLDYDCKTETHTSPTFNCKEEQSPVMEIKQEEESDLKEECQKDSFCKGK
ncbi:hypothetical protein AALO_G00092070 [Alosa alosa]|uniref:Uncharacterized protein n=1 Tax=Alosa alosa TaxID=278164 RepID=A0AAV6GVU7_9TELE|nr:hypothetical protein AALO_G00092070 [Alosa alosa]